MARWISGYLRSAVLVMSIVHGAASAQTSPDPRHPVIANFGEIAPLPGAANQPDPSIAYHIVFSVTAGGKPDQPNTGLDKVARFVNLLGSRGIRPGPGAVVAVIHGPATTLAMTDAAWRARFGNPNPNIALIGALKNAGVDIHVCGQALAYNGIKPDMVSPQVTVDLSAMTTLATLQLKGWALMPD